MPKLHEIVKEREVKKFTKKSYRPWDLSGDRELQSQDIDADANSVEVLIKEKKSEKVDIVNPVTIEFPSFIDNKLDIKKEAIGKQTDNDWLSIGKHIDNAQISHKETIREQLDNSLDPTTIYNQVIKLSGVQRGILDFVADICLIRACLETGPIETSTISTYLNTTNGVIKISLKRLIDKGFITRNKGKTAKGGYLNLSITKETYEAITQQRDKFNRGRNSVELIQTIRQQLDNNALYNSSSINKNTTTKKQETIPDEWLTIDYEVLSQIGFSKTQLKQLIDKNEPILVQDSINHFAYGLEHNPKLQKYEDPLNVLMGVLRKGLTWIEKDYRSPKEIAQQQLLERRKIEAERKQKTEEDAYKLAYEIWHQNLQAEEIENIAPSKKVAGDITPQFAKLNLYFKEKIWPTMKLEYIL